jgi:hypothetical protein
MLRLCTSAVFVLLLSLVGAVAAPAAVDAFRPVANANISRVAVVKLDDGTKAFIGSDNKFYLIGANGSESRRSLSRAGSSRSADRVKRSRCSPTCCCTASGAVASRRRRAVLARRRRRERARFAAAPSPPRARGAARGAAEAPLGDRRQGDAALESRGAARDRYRTSTSG